MCVHTDKCIVPEVHSVRQHLMHVTGQTHKNASLLQGWLSELLFPKLAGKHFRGGKCFFIAVNTCPTSTLPLSLYKRKKKKQTGCVYFVHLYNWLQECHSTFWLQDYVKSLVLSVDAKLLYVLIMLVDLTCYPWYKQLIFVDLKSKESFIHLDCKMVIPFLKKK